MKQKLIMLRGLPASGKSTWAKLEVELSKGQLVRVNKDDLRAMIDSGRHSTAREQSITDIQDSIIEHYIERGKSVIIDNTNFGWENHFMRMAEKYKIEFKIVDFHIPLEECLRRNQMRDDPVPEKSIMYMYNKYVRKAPQYYNGSYIICDIDGTIAHMEGRDPYDGSMAHTDIVDQPIYNILKMYHPTYKIIMVTARDRRYEEVTLQWLNDNSIPYDEIYFRARNDNRCDAVVKKEIYTEEIEPLNGKPLFILDDRNKVVNMWRSLGLKCLQVEPGNF